MKRDVALGIGVAQAGRLDYLGGAINGAKEFCRWAQHQGYETTLLTDEDPANTITVKRLRDTLDAVLSGAPIHRLVIYFAGHGLIREADEGLWLLSDWRADLRAVCLDMLRRRLYRYRVEQIAFFSDACRSLPPDIDAADLTADGVLGTGPDERKERAVDRFVAAQDGAQAFMVPGEIPEEDRCIFSGVVLEALWGLQADAFSKVQPGKITSGSLGKYLRDAVPAKAKEYCRKLDPSVSTSFPEDDNVYFDSSRPLPPPDLPPWPVLGPSGNGGDGLRETISQGNTPGAEGPRDVRDELPGDDPISRDTYMRLPRRRKPTLAQRVRNAPQPDGFETGSGFSMANGLAVAIWLPHGFFAERHGNDNWWRIGEEAGFPLQRSAPVLIEFDDGLFAAVAALPQFIGAVLRQDRRVDAVVYRLAHYPRDTTAMAEEALTMMEQGSLRADAASDLAVRMRIDKHADPVMGVISAYLYESIGDFDNIRRMAFYYCSNNQPIPYDIALLARLNVEDRGGRMWAQVPGVQARQPRTDEEALHHWTYAETWPQQGEVGGAWPWLRQGWLDLEDTMDKTTGMFDPRLFELARYLRPGRFATFEREGAEMLARLFNLTRRTQR